MLKRFSLGLKLLFVVCLVQAAWSLQPEQATRAASATALDPDTAGMVIVEVRHDTVSPLDSVYEVPLYLTNPDVEVNGMDVHVILGRPDLLYAPLQVDTNIVCPGTLTCDTTLDTTSWSPVSLAGSAIAAWNTQKMLVLTPAYFRYISATVGLGDVLAPSGVPQVMYTMRFKRLMPDSVLDTLQDRTIAVHVETLSSFSRPPGNTIGRRDSVICLDPPDCNSLDTIYFDDNVYLSGSLTFLPSCTNGDVNEDGQITSADLIRLVDFVFRGGPPATCAGNWGDTDCSGAINSADIVALVNYVFKGGPAPCA